MYGAYRIGRGYHSQELIPREFELSVGPVCQIDSNSSFEYAEVFVKEFTYGHRAYSSMEHERFDQIDVKRYIVLQGVQLTFPDLRPDFVEILFD
jgi:hypothetical protein